MRTNVEPSAKVHDLPNRVEDDNEQTDDTGHGFQKYSKTTRREKFLTEMDRIVPWGELCALIWSVYPKAGEVASREDRAIDGAKRIKAQR